MESKVTGMAPRTTAAALSPSVRVVRGPVEAFGIGYVFHLPAVTVSSVAARQSRLRQSNDKRFEAVTKKPPTNFHNGAQKCVLTV